MILRYLLVAFCTLQFGCATIMNIFNPMDKPLPVECDPDDDDTFTAVTYNVSVAPGVIPQATPRIPHVAEAVSDIEFDAICIQEAWPSEATDAIVSALELPKENVFTADTSGRNDSGGNKCTRREVRPMLACVRKNCSHVHPEETTKCAMKRCRGTALGMYLFARECLNCLIASVGKSADEIYKTCVRGGGASRVYGGNNGMILASKYPLTNRTVVHLPASGANRVALVADAVLPDGSMVHLGCTQLSSPAVTSPTHPDFYDWEDEQIAQFNMVDRAILKSDSGAPIILMGDFGFSVGKPDTKLYSANIETWQHIERLGWWSPTMHTEGMMCNKCAGNNLLKSSKNWHTSHVLIRKTDKDPKIEPVCADRQAMHKKRIKGYFGKEILTNISYSYAIRVMFSF